MGKAYYSLLEVLCNNHTTVICLCDTATFTHLVRHATAPRAASFLLSV